MYVTVYMACSLSLLLLETKPHVLFVFEVYLLEHLVMDFFSIWARRLSGEAVCGGEHDVTETFSYMTPCRSKLASEGQEPLKIFCSVVVLVCVTFYCCTIKCDWSSFTLFCTFFFFFLQFVFKK